MRKDIKLNSNEQGVRTGLNKLKSRNIWMWKFALWSKKNDGFCRN